MSGVSHSASLNSIAAYLKLINNCDELQAMEEAKDVMRNLVSMRQQGFISGWYFDELGHLALLPSDVMMDNIKVIKK